MFCSDGQRVNHCLLEVEVVEAPQIRYPSENQAPLAEMTVRCAGLRPDDPPAQLKAVGWGNLAQDLKNRVQVGHRLVLEGRLRMSTLPRPDGLREKKAEFTVSRVHPLGMASPGTFEAGSGLQPEPTSPQRSPGAASSGQPEGEANPQVWNTSPLNPADAVEGDDEIPF